MEHVEGTPIDEYCRKQGLDVPERLRLFATVCDAVIHAHRHLIIHRDIKPSNILVTPDGTPKLLDFGIAKLKNAAALRLTTDGAVMGSPLYMAPEQARGEDVDERADLWALCVVLYEAITGNPPFMGESRTEVIRAASEATPLRLSHHGVEDESI